MFHYSISSAGKNTSPANSSSVSFFSFSAVRLASSRIEVFSYLDRIEKSLKEQGFSASRAGSEDIKRILDVYYERNVTCEKFEDFNGERWIIPDD